MILLTFQPKLLRPPHEGFSPDFKTLMVHKAFLSTWCKTFLHTREKEVFFLNTLKISLTQNPQEGPFQVMFVAQHTKEQKKQKKLNTRERKGQDTTKRTFAPAESCIHFHWSVMPISMTPLTWMVETYLTEPPSRISQRRSMKQDLSDSTIAFTYW